MFVSATKKARGASLISAIFLITALASLGALMSKLTIFSTRTTLQDYYAAQAFAAANSGLEWAGWCIETKANSSDCDNVTVAVASSSCHIAVTNFTLDNLTIFVITSEGRAGEGGFGASRLLEAHYIKPP
ncbi:MAG: hypothetical protein HQL49_03165 [Gammaproteobacteria bacterium]|nr:hypothetical protein [Gammaproteobacteria bacterium]